MTKKARDVLQSFCAPINRSLPVVALLVCLSIHAPANAIPIGDFVWSEHTSDECEFGVCGAFFFVDNFGTEDSALGLLGDSFFDVLVNLQTDTGAQSLSLGDILAFGYSQSIDPLDAIISSAGLSLTFGAPKLPGSIRLLDEAGGIVAALTAQGSLLIDYVAPVVEPPPVTVPEPSTLLLLGGALVGFAGLRKGKPEHKIDAKDRDQVSAA